MTLSQEFKRYERNMDNIVKDQTREAFLEIESNSPVDIGTLKDSWIYKYLNGDVRISSAQIDFYLHGDYNMIIWNGRKKINGRWYGSVQGWGLNGGDIVWQKHTAKIIERIRAL